jgi:hypothetical protein
MPGAGAGDGAGDGLAALVGLGVHARALELAQDAVAIHGEVEQPLGGIVAGLGADGGERVQVHATGEGVLAGGQHDPLDRVVGERLIDQRLDGGEGLPA